MYVHGMSVASSHSFYRHPSKPVAVYHRWNCCGFQSAKLSYKITNNVLTIPTLCSLVDIEGSSKSITNHPPEG